MHILSDTGAQYDDRKTLASTFESSMEVEMEGHGKCGCSNQAKSRDLTKCPGLKTHGHAMHARCACLSFCFHMSSTFINASTI